LKYWNRIGKPLVQEVRFDPELPLNALLRERTFAISGGQVLTANRLETTRSNLDRLRVFTSERFELSPRDDGRYDLTFRSSSVEQPMTGWIGTLLPFVRGLPYQTVNVDLTNLGRRAINVSFLGRWDV